MSRPRRRAPKRWTPEEEEYLIAHYADGDVMELADKLERSWQAIISKANSLGVVRTESAKQKTNDKIRESYVGRRKRYNPNPMTPLTIKMICWYTEDGDSVTDIAGLIHRPKQKVQKILDECLLDGRYDRYSRERQERLEQALKAGQSLILMIM